MGVRTQGLRNAGCAVMGSVTLVAGGLALLASQNRQANRRQRHANLYEQQRLEWELLSRAIADADLAAVLDTYDEELPYTKQRQFLFANGLYTNILLALRTGVVNESEFRGHIRFVLQNPVFKEYWRVTSKHRASLGADSEEAQIGTIVDRLLSDLEEDETGEWWIVGEPPEE
ncbi:DUF6082 family protein [Streptomyces sp. NPDC050738]|uniref:DUF6082 family protein n=1 Tax=Streptomyces sp. NPDC050738 TaxID=3154744 RepID=UPI003415A9D3